MVYVKIVMKDAKLAQVIIDLIAIVAYKDIIYMGI